MGWQGLGVLLACRRRYRELQRSNFQTGYVVIWKRHFHAASLLSPSLHFGSCNATACIRVYQLLAHCWGATAKCSARCSFRPTVNAPSNPASLFDIEAALAHQ